MTDIQTATHAGLARTTPRYRFRPRLWIKVVAAVLVVLSALWWWTGGPVTVLIMGVDGGAERSDIMMVAHITPRNGSVRLLSIPRDLRVEIPGRKRPEKITHAHAYGGAELARETVEQLLGIRIPYFVEVDFEAFIHVVDLVGGVDVVVEHNMYYVDPYQDLVINIKKGPQHLDGKQALGYVRYRNDRMGDFGRIERQQEVIAALLQRARETGLIRKLPSVAPELLSYVKTNLPPTRLVSLARAAARLRADRVTGVTLKVDDVWVQESIGRVYYLTAEPEDIAAAVAELIGQK